jgi:hypothetical protein
VDPERAETYLRMLAEPELCRLTSPSRHDPRLARIWLAAAALIAAGVSYWASRRVRDVHP